MRERFNLYYNMIYLELKDVKCKDCYKCLRGCPVKAIEYIDQKARIIEDRCILCGNCTLVCPQNAKFVHTEVDNVVSLIENSEKVVASLAPSFVSSFSVGDFEVMRTAFKKLGFFDVEETAVGAKLVTDKYKELLKKKTYKNFITSCCPSVNDLIEKYYPNALQYLARVDSPMVAHGKIIREKYKGEDVKVVFVGPCIAKKREGFKSPYIDGVLTFEDLQYLFRKNGISLNEIQGEAKELWENKARFYPISRGIIKSFDNDYVDSYEYLAVDGVNKCMEVLENIESYEGMFLELNACEYACVNGPCALTPKGTALKANGEIRKYANKGGKSCLVIPDVDINHVYPMENIGGRTVSETEIQEILNSIGKKKKEDELDCGACGYSTCREKAWAVANGYAEREMCLPYMRKRAESMSYEIIKNSPNGIVVVDYDFKILDMNVKAQELWGVKDKRVKGNDLVNYCDPTPMIMAVANGTNINKDKVLIDKTNKFVQMSVNLIAEHRIVFVIMRDITSYVKTDEEILEMKMHTIKTTDEVIKKQMRVAQEIASLLGETTAETKVALLKLKKTLAESDKGDK